MNDEPDHPDWEKLFTLYRKKIVELGKITEKIKILEKKVPTYLRLFE